MRYNARTLEKITAILHENDYKIVYGKGNFQSGYCLLENRKMIVINKFLDLPTRVQAFIDIVSMIEVDAEKLDMDLQKFYYKDLISEFKSRRSEEVSQSEAVVG